MKHTQLFIDSLFYPKKLASYRLLPIGKVLQYAFLLVLFTTLFSFGQFTNGVSTQTLNMEGLTEYIQDIQWLLYPLSFLLLFVMTTLLIFARISIYAAVAHTFLPIMKKRGEYRHLWRTSAFAVTWETLLSLVFTFTSLSETIVLIISIITTCIILVISLTKYPTKI